MKRFLNLMVLIVILLAFSINVEATPSKESLILEEKISILNLYSDVYEYLEYCISLRNKDFNIARKLIGLNISDISIGFDIENNNIAVFNNSNPTDCLLITENFIVKEFFDKYNPFFIKINPLLQKRSLFGFVIITTTVTLVAKVFWDIYKEKKTLDIVEKDLPDGRVEISTTYQIEVFNRFKYIYETKVILQKADEAGNVIPGGEMKEVITTDEEFKLEFDYEYEETETEIKDNETIPVPNV